MVIAVIATLAEGYETIPVVLQWGGNSIDEEHFLDKIRQFAKDQRALTAAALIKL